MNLEFKTGIEKEELNTIAELLNKNLQYDKFDTEILGMKIFDDPNFNPDLIIRSYDGNKLVGFLHGVKGVYHERFFGWIRLFVVDKEYQLKGIATKMFDIIEEKFNDCDEIHISDSVPNYYNPGIDPRYTEAVVFVQKRGYEKESESIYMDCDLTKLDFNNLEELSSELKKNNVKIVRGDKKIYTILMQWVKGLFPLWEYEINLAYRNSPAKIFLAIKDDKVVGFTTYDVTNKGWFGPIGVDVQFRKFGIGRVLLLSALEELKNIGYKTCVIPWINISVMKFYLTGCDAKISRIFWVYSKPTGKHSHQ